MSNDDNRMPDARERFEKDTADGDTVAKALAILDRAPDVEPDEGDEIVSVGRGIAELDRGDSSELDDVLAKARAIVDAAEARRPKRNPADEGGA